MIKLKCSECRYMWKETKAQERSLKVFCPNCETLHHKHSQPIKPMEKREFVTWDKPEKGRKSDPLKPYKKKLVIKKTLDDKVKSTEYI